MLHTSEILSSPEPEVPSSSMRALGEARVLLDFVKLPFSLIKSHLNANSKSDSKSAIKYQVVLVPGYASDERFLYPLKKFIENLDHQVEGWGLGTNFAGTNLDYNFEDISDSWDLDEYPNFGSDDYNGQAGVSYLCDLTGEAIRKKVGESGHPVVVIGWSLGGVIAREVARDLPQEVAHVITLGTPVVGGPKYTKVGRVFQSKGIDLDWIEEQTRKRNLTPIRQPITAVFSKTDGIVDWRAMIDKQSESVQHHEVNVSHLGMGFNPSVWQVIKESLSAHGQSNA